MFRIRNAIELKSNDNLRILIQSQRMPKPPFTFLRYRYTITMQWKIGSQPPKQQSSATITRNVSGSSFVLGK